MLLDKAGDSVVIPARLHMGGSGVHLLCRDAPGRLAVLVEGTSEEAILSAAPNVAVSMAKALPDVREHIVNRIIRRTAGVNALISLEPIPGLDIPLLLASQTRLVLRIAAVYGRSMSISHARELLTTMAGSLLSRYLGMQLAKLVPGLGWLVSAALSAVTTWGMGQAARHYFEAGGNIQAPNLRQQYRRMRQLAPGRLLKRSADQGKDHATEPNTESWPDDVKR